MKRVSLEALAVGAVLLIAFSLRLWGISYDLPYIYHPDEPLSIAISEHIFKTGDLNPHWFEYPSLYFYIHSLVYIPYYLLLKFYGVFQTRTDIITPITLVMGSTYAPMPGLVLVGRILTVICGVATAGLTFAIGKRLTGNAAAGLLASLMVAVSPSNVSNSRFITPDTIVVFFATVTFLAAILVYQEGRTRYYLIAGLAAGLTASTKYNGALILVSLLAAHYFRRGERRKLYLGLILCGLAFLGTTPFALVDWRLFLRGAGYQALHYATGHAGMEGEAFKWYLDNLWHTVALISILALVEILRGLFGRRKEIMLLAIFPLVYFGFIARMAVRNDRTFLPITPFLFVLAASFLVHLHNQAKEVGAPARRKASMLAIACLSVAALVQPVDRTITAAARLMVVNSRETARVWISDNLSGGTKIALESYSPFLQPTRFAVQGFESMIDHGPEWYVANGFEYLVFSQDMYGRFYREPAKYSAEVSRYDRLFRRFTLTRLFTDGDYEVRLYRVKQAEEDDRIPPDTFLR